MSCNILRQIGLAITNSLNNESNVEFEKTHIGFINFKVGCLSDNLEDVAEWTPEPDLFPCKNPIFSPLSCELYPNDFITLTCETESAKIYYTLDGSTPTTTSYLYSSPIEMTFSDVTIKAFAQVTGFTNSDIVTKSYTLIQ